MLALLPVGASAYTITVGGPLQLMNIPSTPDSPLPAQPGPISITPFNFDQGNVSFTNDRNPQAGIYQGNLPGTALSPFGSVSVSTYLVAQSGLQDGVTNNVVMHFNGPQTMFGLLWGTVDAYNELDFYLNGAKVETIKGDMLGVAADGTQNVNVTITGLSSFDEVVAVDHDSPAFEFVPDPVPEPRSIMLLGLGLLALGTARKIKRKTPKATA